MTDVLLDTHAYVWALTAAERLGPAAEPLLRDRSTRLLVSAATAWEMAIKHRAGRWPEVEPLLAQHGRLVSRLGAEMLPIDSEDALVAGSMTWEHRDPFDRVLAAQALRRDLRLLSRDAAFAAVHGLRVVW